MKKQKILCDVCTCKYHNNENGCGCCNLDQITVTPTPDCCTAHYCKNYQKKSNN